MNKRIIAFVLAFAMFLTFVPFIGMAAAPKYDAVVSIDGIKVGFTNKPYVQGDTLYVPVEELAGYLKFETKGNDYGTGITIKNGDIEALLQNGNMFVDTTAGNVQLKNAPVFEKGVFYAPIDVFSDVFNYPVNQDVDNRSANITSGYYRFEISEENAAVVSVDDPEKDILNTSATGSDQLVYNEISEPPQEISAFYKFDMTQIAGKKIKSATLKYNAARGGQYTPTPRFVKADNWDKATINYNNQPKTYPDVKADGTRIPGSLRTGTFQDWSVDITALVSPTEDNPIVSMKIYGLTYQSATTVNKMRTVQVNMKGVNTPQRAYIEVICDEQLSFPAYTEEVLTVVEQSAFDQVAALTKLGVLTPEDEFPSEITEYVTRGEFVHYAVRLLNDNFDYAPEAGKEYFVDVPADHQYYNAINTAVANGVIALADDGEFRPDDYITPTEAIIIVDRILGYEDYARHNQNYPTGYILVAQQAGLLEKVNTSGEEFSYKDMFQLFFNAMSAPLMTIVSYSSTGEAIYDFDENKSLMSEEFDAYEVEGILSANNYTDLDYTKSVSDNMIKIGDTAYFTENDDFNELIGYRVTAYYKENDIGQNEVVYVGLTQRNSSIIIDYNDVSSVSPNLEGYLVKYENGTEEDEVQIYKSKPIIYNGKAIAPNQLTQSMLKGEIGTITLVSNGGAEYDVLFVDSYKTIIANGIDTEQEIIFDKYNSALKLSPSGKDFFVLKKTSKNLEVSEIKTGDVISYTESIDGKYIKGYVSNSIMNGEIQSVFKENGEVTKVTIKGVEFEVRNRYPEWTQDLNPGLSGTYYFDNFGNIVNFETNEVNNKFGVVIGVDISTRISKDVTIAIHTGDTEEYKTYKVAKTVRVTDVNDLTNYNDTPVSNADVKGFFYTNDQLNTARQGITFSLNSDKEVSEISTLYFTDYTSDNSNGGAGLWYKNSKFQDFFYINSDTIRVKEPEGTDNTVLDDYEIIMGSFTADEKYPEIKTYTTDPEKPVVDIIMLPFSSSSGTAVTSNLSIVTNLVSAVDEEGELIKKITVNESGTSKTFVIPHDYINAPLFDTIEIGDIVRYGSNYKGELNCKGTLDSQIALSKIYDYSSKTFETSKFVTSVNNEKRIYGGYVYDKEGDYVKFVDAVKYAAATEKDINNYDPITDYKMFNWYRFPSGSDLYKYDVKNGGREVSVTSASTNNMVTYKDLGYAASGLIIQSRYESLNVAYIVDLIKTVNTGRLVASFTGGEGALGNVTYRFNEGETLTVPDGTGFSKAGYKLVGWTDNLGNSYNIGDSVLMTGDLVFTAVWQQAHYVKFVPGDNVSGSMDDITIQTAGSVITIPVCGYTKTGYALDYWTDGTNNYNEGDTITADDTRDIVLTAAWTNTNVSQISFNSGLSIEVKYIKNGNSYVLPAVENTANATFVGWTSDNGATVEDAGTNVAASGDAYYEAVWQMKINFTNWVKVNTSNEVYVNGTTMDTHRTIGDMLYFEFPTSGISNTTGIIEAKVVFNRYHKYNATSMTAYRSSNLSDELLELTDGSSAASSVLPVTGATISEKSEGALGSDDASETDALVDHTAFAQYLKDEINGGNTKVTFMMKDTFSGNTANGVAIKFYPESSYVSVKLLGSALPAYSANATYTFAGNGNTGGSAPAGNTVAKGSVITLPYCTFTKTGFTFEGWSDGSNIYTPGGQLNIMSDTVFTAQWKAILNYVAVTYKANGGTGADIENQEGENSTILLPECTFTNGAAEFAGWNDGTNTYEPGTAYEIGTTPVIFNAVWVTKYGITFAGGDGTTGTAPTMERTQAGSTITLPANTFEKTNYVFAGWNDGTNTYAEGAPYTMPANDVTFTAVWQTPKTITFVPNNGSAQSEETYAPGAQITLPTPVKTASVGSYTFAGWDDGTSTYAGGASYTVTDSKTLTAQWTYVGGTGSLPMVESIYWKAASTSDTANGTATKNPVGGKYLYRYSEGYAVYYAKFDISGLKNVTDAEFKLFIQKVNNQSDLTFYEISETAYNNAFGSVTTSGVSFAKANLPETGTRIVQTRVIASGNATSNVGYFVNPSTDMTTWLAGKVASGENYIYLKITNASGGGLQDGVRVFNFHTKTVINVTTAND